MVEPSKVPGGEGSRQEMPKGEALAQEMVAQLHEKFPNLQLGLERIAQVYDEQPQAA